jgi:hypothetical protein
MGVRSLGGSEDCLKKQLSVSQIEHLQQARKKYFIQYFRDTIKQSVSCIVRNRWFERTILLLILGNCLTMVLYDPLDQTCEASRCHHLQMVELSFLILFILEMIMRIITFGCKGYFGAGWNRLDFIVILVGLLEFIPGVRGSFLAAFRIARVLRPLRVVNRFPSLRILVHLLLDIIPMLGSVMVICFFLFVTFGTIGVQMWKGVLRGGCYTINGTGPYLPSEGIGYEYVCSLEGVSGLLKCPPPYLDAEDYTECQLGGPNSFRGAVSFDHILSSMTLVFQIVSLEVGIIIIHV